MTIMHIFGAEITDKVFTIETAEGEINWNVTKLEAAADRGDFGPAKVYPIKGLARPLYDNVDQDYIEALRHDPIKLARPVIGIGKPPGSIVPVLCIADGNHRLIARQENNMSDFAMYVVPWDVEKNFRVTMIEGNLL